ncbi:hypothetical protein VST63_05700 [Mycolicibacterium sp. 050232]|uniref:Rv0361 family membrane protein n=1 Tax=Mycolicibacterium sp. 050232 TaxID=3113982 RepID=UPI002E2C2A0B|nr:hypothetical protein [Mycolicibacterium sp. 050232]MED5811850.1 hypothetical protein [Mycolicibacterium sp. 050232]
MTYPPIPPTGPTGPWQQPYPQQPGGPQGYPNADQPYGSPYGAPQQPYGDPQQPYGAPQQPYGDPQQPYGDPQQPYGAPQQPQQPYGNPYGAPQAPYGAPYGAQQPYGAPQQPYGYPTPQPPKGGNGKLLAIGGAVIAVLAVVVGVIFFAVNGDSKSNGGSTSAGSSQASDAEQEVRDFLDEVMASSSDLSEALPYFCQADQDLLDKIGGVGAIDVPKSTDSGGSEADISKITVNGDKAVVDISTNRGAAKLYLRKESGSWKICMSDSPQLSGMR